MLAAHVHLALNSAPAFFVSLGLAVFAAAAVLGRSRWEGGALGLFVAAALFVLPVYFTGEPTEHLVKGMAGVSAALIHRHEDAAQLTLTALLVLGALAGLGLALELARRARPWPLRAATVLAALVAVALSLRTTHFGGEIRHPEIRWEAAEAVDAAGLDSKTESHEPVDRD